MAFISFVHPDRRYHLHSVVMNSNFIVATVMLWNVFVLGGSVYLVFAHDASILWVILALGILSGVKSTREVTEEKDTKPAPRFGRPQWPPLQYIKERQVQ